MSLIFRVATALVCLICAWAQVARAEVPAFEYLPGAQPDHITRAMTRADWRPGQGVAQFGISDHPRWLRYRLPPADGPRIFSIDDPWLYAVDFYLVRDGEVVRVEQAGSSRVAIDQSIMFPGFAVPLGTNIDMIYVHDLGQSSGRYPVSLSSPAEFSSFGARLNLLHGLYYGIVLLMVVYNLALFVGSRDASYLFYSMYGASLMAFLITVDGTGSLFIWPQQPALPYVLVSIGWGCTLGFLLEFARRFLHLDPPLARIHRWTQGAVAVLAIMTVLFPSPETFLVLAASSALILALLMYDGVHSLRAGQPTARIFLVANGMLAAGGLAYLMMLFGMLPANTLTQHAIHIGSVLELALLGVGLAIRIRNNEQAHWEALQQTQELTRHNRELRAARSLAEEHRQLQKSLQQAQKLKTIGQLAGGFAHDFNNILASILGFAELAQNPKAQSDRLTLSKYLEEIRRAGERGAVLVKQLLVYSRNSPAEPVNLDLGDTLTQARELLRGSLPATVAIETHLPDQSVQLRSDPEQLQQVLVNLCLNAAEAMRNRGQIDIRLETVNLSGLTCSSCLSRFSGEYIALKVEDTGPGIRGNASQLFTPFHTTKEIRQGTGLGLSVVHGITHEHGGHVHAANRAEGGARFAVYLPLNPAPSLARPGRRRVLIVEDDPSVASYLATLLGAEDFEPTVKEMPIHALETFVADPDAYDLVITDHLMPHGTGLELAEDVHALRPDLPVILMTGNANNLDHNDLENAGIRGVFQKPLNSEQLLAKIRGLLA